MALEDKTVTFDCYVPVANTQEESYALLGDDTEEIAFTSYTPVYQPKRVKIEIVGIVDPWYQETMGYQNIYLPIDLLESLRLEATNESELKENEERWYYNAYRVYGDDITHMEQTNITLKQISGLITTGNAYMDYDQRFKSLSYIKVISLATLIVVLGIGCILAYAYGIYYYQKK